MGICATKTEGKSSGNTAPSAKTAEKKDPRKEAKLVLLGPGESGKSTLFKQMKIIQSSEIPLDERMLYVNAVYSNIISQMKTIAMVCQKSGAKLSNEANVETVRQLADSGITSSNWTAELGRKLQALWAEPDVKRLYTDRGKTYQLNDGAGYLFDHLERINAEHYVPTVEDYLRVRIRTTGAEEAVFEYEGVAFRVADVGGQRIERRKWKQAVDNATAFIFCAAMSEYDQTLREDETQNRMKETLLMFEEIVTGELTARIPVILLLNKTDLFRAKIAHTPLTVFWSAYAGGSSFEATSSFVRKQFLDLGPPGAEIYTHFTCAIDTENIRLVWKDVRETIYKKLLKGAGAGFLM